LKVHKKILIFAVLIGILTIFALNRYIISLQKALPAQAQVSYSKVVVAAGVIPANVKITGDMVTLKSIPSESVHPEAITSMDKVVGKIANSQIVKGEQVLSSRILGDVSKATLAYRVPEGMRAVTIPNSEITGVAGHINAGDRIDILVNHKDPKINPLPSTYTQFQNIEIAAVGTPDLSQADGKKPVTASITVFVNPVQAEELVYAVTNASLFLTLRNPVDTANVNLNPYNASNFSTYKER
jgi:pilus assembly protein CpaB